MGKILFKDEKTQRQYEKCKEMLIGSYGKGCSRVFLAPIVIGNTLLVSAVFENKDRASKVIRLSDSVAIEYVKSFRGKDLVEDQYTEMINLQ